MISMIHWLLCAALAAQFALLADAEQTLNEIRVRDPFILADSDTQTYFLYAQIANRLPEDSPTQGV